MKKEKNLVIPNEIDKINRRQKKQEVPQCDKTRFSTTSDMTGIRNEIW